jgi:hypothetical protein
MESEVTHREQQAKQRDLALIMFGMSLVTESRDRVLSSIPPGAVCKEIDVLTDALREKKWSIVKTYLEARGAVIESGKDAVQAVIDAVNAIERRAKIKKIVGELQYATKIEDVPALKDRLSKCLEELNSI